MYHRCTRTQEICEGLRLQTLRRCLSPHLPSYPWLQSHTIIFILHLSSVRSLPRDKCLHTHGKQFSHRQAPKKKSTSARLGLGSAQYNKRKGSHAGFPPPPSPFFPSSLSFSPLGSLTGRSVRLTKYLGSFSFFDHMSKCSGGRGRTKKRAHPVYLGTGM